MKSNHIPALALIIVIGSSTLAAADIGIPWVGWITSPTSADASLLVLPDGSGPALSQATLFGGEVVDATITVGLIDQAGIPIANFPYQDVWLDPEVATDFPCPAAGAFWSDANTDANGETTFAKSLAGGGWSEGPVWVYLNGGRSIHPQNGQLPPVPRRFNSPDIDGDGLVNLSDVAIFAGDFHGTYQYRADFHWDGVLNLADLVMMATGLGRDCQ